MTKPRSDIDETTGCRLRATRMAAGLTATATARAAGISRTTLWNLERGETRPSLLVLCSLARVFRCPPERLLDGEGE